MQKKRQRQWRKRWIWFWVLPIVMAGFLLCFYPKAKPILESNYARFNQIPVDRADEYPIEQAISTTLYRPVGRWVGRLILPKQEEMQRVGVRTSGTTSEDWAFFEVQVAPADVQALVGRVVRLEWSQEAVVQSYVWAGTRTVRFTAATAASQRQGNLHPERLDRRVQVGPLQSLAGARPNDDVVVRLEQVEVVWPQPELGVSAPPYHLAEAESGQEPERAPSSRDDTPVLRISQEPIQVTGRFYGLVSILGPTTEKDSTAISTFCSNRRSCTGELFRVRHYNSESQQFDGAVDVVRIPQVPHDRNGVYRSTIHQLEASPAGDEGWYIYGAKDRAGTFVVQAIAPRSLFRLQPDTTIVGLEAGKRYLKRQHWHDPEAQKGKVSKVLVDPEAKQPEAARLAWKEGDRALVVHLFGGIGGARAESAPLGMVTGHFAYGLAQVVRDPFTRELQFAIQYWQVYAHNPDGIVSGTMDWAAYMGNLQRGWLGSRPVSDVLVKLEAVSRDYNFAGQVLSPLQALGLQLDIMMARYRVGDGTGSAIVTPATSCVQDSNQALYSTIKQIEQQVGLSPMIQQWLRSHPTDRQNSRFQQLVNLGTAIEQQLVPLGAVRPDWQQNAVTLAGIQTDRDPIRTHSLLAALLSWRTILPRRAHDEIVRLFLDRGAQLWVLRTNQVGGWDPEIQPSAPTILLGRFPAIALPVSRLIAAAMTLPGLRDWLVAAGTLLIYGLIALPLGFRQGFLTWGQPLITPLRLQDRIGIALRAAIAPALVEELIFRVLLLPHPTAGIAIQTWLLWGMFSLLLFLLYHPLNALTFARFGFPTFLQPTFLTLAGLLGLACTVVYQQSGSLWTITAMHWIIVTIWVLWLGGHQKLGIRQRIEKAEEN